MNPGKKVFQTKPPDKGSFPLDHDGKIIYFLHSQNLYLIPFSEWQTTCLPKFSWDV